MKLTYIYILIAAFSLIVLTLVFSKAEAPTQVEEGADVEAEVMEHSDDDHGAAMEAEIEVAPVPDTPVEAIPDGAATKVFTLDSFSYGYSETEIRVKEGEVVTINLTNSGGYHDWVLDEFNAATAKIRQGDTTSVTFVASKKGTFEFYCSIGNHRAEGMVGNLIVE